MNSVRQAYTTGLGLIGIILVLLGIRQVGLDPSLTFFLLVALGVLSQVTMTAFVQGDAGVSVSSAVSLTAAYLFGPLPAALVAASAELGLWLMRNGGKLRDPKQNWHQQFERLGVNIGMNAIAAMVAGVTLLQVGAWLPQTEIWGQAIPWIAAAVIGDQVNLWLLIIVIYLVTGAKPLRVWRDNRWAIPINVLVMSVGGGLLTLAVQQFDLLGVAIFFLPIVLSAYSFRLTVSNTKKQMVMLEEMVTERTAELAEANQQLEQNNRQMELTNHQLGQANSQLAEANDQLAEANSELQSLHKEKNAFLAVLTHDMRTPLTSIKGYASILHTRELEREQQVKISKVILNSQETLLDIVNNILEIEKYQSGAPIVLEREHFDLALLAKDGVESIAASAMEKQIALHCDEVPDPVIISADTSKMQRVLLNLISNAVKYTPEGGEVFVETVANGRFAHFTVRDTGYGIPEDELPTIFDRYSRVKKHQQLAVGTGLGLAVVKSLVEAHDGEISVSSEVDVGSVFSVKLPLAV